MVEVKPNILASFLIFYWSWFHCFQYNIQLNSLFLKKIFNIIAGRIKTAIPTLKQKKSN